MIGRANFAVALVEGALSRRGDPFDALALAKRHGHEGGLDELLLFYGQLLEGAAPADSQRKRLLDVLGARPEPRRAVALMLAAPEYHLA